MNQSNVEALRAILWAISEEPGSLLGREVASFVAPKLAAAGVLLPRVLECNHAVFEEIHATMNDERMPPPEGYSTYWQACQIMEAFAKGEG